MAARRPCSCLLVAGGLCGPVDPLIVAQVLGRVVFVEGLCGHVGAIGRADVLGASLLFVSSFCVRVPGSISGPMHERAKRRAYHSNGCPT